MMHRSIRDRLEDLLSGERLTAEQPQVSQHLASCQECSSELSAMKGHSELLRELRAPAEVEPTAGFYARVVQRIEERARESAWGAFIDSAFGKRLAYASLTIAVGLGTYVITAELQDGHLGGPRIVAQQFSGGAVVTGDPTERRNAVLVDFAAYRPQSRPYQEGSPQ
jgi:anti-sigma factor RsiW